MFSEKWDTRFLKLAVEISTWSKDPTRKVGCVIVNQDMKVRSIGYNGFPTWFNDDAMLSLSKHEKSDLITHAEVNALNNLSHEFLNEKLYMYITIAPCYKCTLYIVNSVANIEGIVYASYGSDEFQKRHCIDKSLNMLKSNTINTRYMDIDNVCKVIHNPE